MHSMFSLWDAAATESGSAASSGTVPLCWAGWGTQPLSWFAWCRPFVCVSQPARRRFSAVWSLYMLISKRNIKIIHIMQQKELFNIIIVIVILTTFKLVIGYISGEVYWEIAALYFCHYQKFSEDSGVNRWVTTFKLLEVYFFNASNWIILYCFWIDAEREKERGWREKDK